MTADEFRQLQRTMNMDVAHFAAFFCIGERTVRRINAGDYDVPPWIQTYGPMLVDMATGAWGDDVRRYIFQIPRVTKARPPGEVAGINGEA